MEILQNYNLTRFMAFIPTIRKSIAEWRIVEASLTGKTPHNIAFIAKKMQRYFTDSEGIIFICNQREILALVHTGKGVDPATLSKGINDNVPEHSCVALAGEASAEGLLTIQLKFEEKKGEHNQSASHLLTARQQRENNVVMVVDDDSFIRSLISKTLVSKAHVLEIDDSMDIVEAYLEHLPDVMFLDIHMPKVSGIEMLEEILNFDDSAYVVIISADSNRDNVLDAKKLGAKGFLAKPFTKEKLESCYNKCSTIRKP
jgi:two-component system chemotaxis response regulator CheY